MVKDLIGAILLIAALASQNAFCASELDLEKHARRCYPKVAMEIKNNLHKRESLSRGFMAYPLGNYIGGELINARDSGPSIPEIKFSFKNDGVLWMSLYSDGIGNMDLFLLDSDCNILESRLEYNVTNGK